MAKSKNGYHRDHRNQYRNQYASYYSNTSEAYDINAFPQEEQKKTVRRIFRRRRNKPTYKYVGETISKISIFTMVTIVLIFAGCLSMAFTFATLMNKQAAIVALSQDLKSIQESNVVLEAEISKNYDIKEIERIATTELGMSKPKSHQIISIHVPKQSYAILHEKAEDGMEKNSLFARVADFLTKRY